tara:strand:+ start:138 stop:341 length:204 start_codon:yes stop_codon:yes gene_type:complete
MNNEIREEIIKSMKKYNPDDFDLYCCEAGWESWMEEYTESEDGEVCTESELDEITEIQKELWEDAHK